MTVVLRSDEVQDIRIVLLMCNPRQFGMMPISNNAFGLIVSYQVYLSERQERKNVSNMAIEH